MCRSHCLSVLLSIFVPLSLSAPIFFLFMSISLFSVQLFFLHAQERVVGGGGALLRSFGIKALLHQIFFFEKLSIIRMTSYLELTMNWP